MSHGNVLNIPVALDPRFSRGIGEELDQGNLQICQGYSAAKQKPPARVSKPILEAHPITTTQMIL